MIAIGLTFAWLAVQVSIVLGPGIVVYALAARRGPAAGASAALLGLGMVVTLTVAAFLPGIGPEDRVGPGRIDQEAAPIPDTTAGVPAETVSGTAGGGSIDWRRFAGWRVAWDRLGRGAAGPASRCRPWAGGLGVLFLFGATMGLLRMAVGIVAIVACRRRGRVVDDPAMIGLLDELRGAIGCRRDVELREVDDLIGPATAGWRRPLILLPDDWRSWDDSERRAVLAHELAHVVRGDYAAGLVARLAMVLHGYHPMVWWLAGQLRWQQELSADAIGARHAGGRYGYLVALSRMALRQDGRSPCWPARAFFPARGTLIRRITMLRDETRNETIERPGTRGCRLATAAFLLGLTAAVMTLRGPARGEDGAPVGAQAGAPAGPAGGIMAPPLFVREGVNGVVVFRPAAAARHPGSWVLMAMLDDLLGLERSAISDGLNRLDLSGLVGQKARREPLNLRMEDLEWVTFGIRFSDGGMNKEGRRLHRIDFSAPALRTVAPFNWLAFLRQCRIQLAEVRHGGRVYYKATGPIIRSYLGPDIFVSLPDDRTLVFGLEEEIRKLAGGASPPAPAFLRGPEWEAARRGLFAVVISNEDGRMAKGYDLGRPDDAIVMQLFQGVDRWILGMDDTDSIALHATAIPAPGASSEAIARAVADTLKRAREALDRAVAAAEPGQFQDLGSRMERAAVAALRVEPSDRSIVVHAGGFGTIADLAGVVEEAIRSQSLPSKP